MKLSSLLLRLILFISSFFAASLTSQAALIEYSGTFDVNFTDSAVSKISGAWATSFDDSGVLGIGTEFFNVSPTTFTMSPSPLGTTTFDTTNVGISLYFIDGVPSNIVMVGGLINAIPAVSAAADDFSLSYNSSGALFSGLYSISTESGVAQSATAVGTVSIASIPIPAAVWLFSSGLLGLVGIAKSKMA